jgi:hypothetical protein
MMTSSWGRDTGQKRRGLGQQASGTEEKRAKNAREQRQRVSGAEAGSAVMESRWTWTSSRERELVYDNPEVGLVRVVVAVASGDDASRWSAAAARDDAGSPGCCDDESRALAEAVAAVAFEEAVADSVSASVSASALTSALAA